MCSTTNSIPQLPDLYNKLDDPAAHASRGRTARTEVMYSAPGHVYVYRIHQQTCLNIVTEPDGRPGCVLIRAVQPILGVELMQLNRPGIGPMLTNGPGKLCQAMGIRMDLYGADVCDPTSPLQLHEQPADFQRGEIIRTPRIGVTRGAEPLLRFALAGNPYLSRRS